MKGIFIFLPILTWYCCCWMNCIESFRHYVDGFLLYFTVSEINLTKRDRKVQISKILKVLFFIQFECSFCKVFILRCYWWAIKCAISFQKGTQIPKFCIFDSYIEFLFFIQFWWVFVVVIDEWIVLSAFGNMSTVPSVFYWTTPIFFYWNPTLMGYNWTLNPM